MESESPSPGKVKRVGRIKRTKSPRKNSGLCLSEGCKRVRGYLLGCFSQGKEFHDWDKHAFHRRTQWIRGADGGKNPYRNPLSVRHIERIVGYYRRSCSEFLWAEIRVGRSTRLRVSVVNPDVPAVPVYEVRRRLVGYIRGAVDANGVAKVDATFLQHFQRASALPMELIHLVWLKTKKMAGFRARWRGVNNGRKLVVSRSASPTHFRPGPISTYCVSEGIKPKTTGLTPRLDPNESSASRCAAGVTGPGVPVQSAASNAPPGDKRTDRPAPPASIHDPPRWHVLIVCDRPVDGRKLAKLAALLAVTRMRTPHDEYWRVKWFFNYARNFAYRALREGFDVARICEEYRRGVGRSHEDSLDADRAVNEKDGWRREPQRVPSAAVAYARRELMRDGGDREERWEQIFARGARADPPVPPAEVAQRPRPPAPGPIAKANPRAGLEQQVFSAVAAGRRRSAARPQGKTIDELRDLLASSSGARAKPGEQLLPGPELTAGELAEFLREQKQMTLAQFTVLGWTWKKAIVAEALRWKRFPKG